MFYVSWMFGVNLDCACYLKELSTVQADGQSDIVIQCVLMYMWLCVALGWHRNRESSVFTCKASCWYLCLSCWTESEELAPRTAYRSFSAASHIPAPTQHWHQMDGSVPQTSTGRANALPTGLYKDASGSWLHSVLILNSVTICQISCCLLVQYQVQLNTLNMPECTLLLFFSP